MNLKKCLFLIFFDVFTFFENFFFVSEFSRKDRKKITKFWKLLCKIILFYKIIVCKSIMLKTSKILYITIKNVHSISFLILNRFFCFLFFFFSNIFFESFFIHDVISWMTKCFVVNVNFFVMNVNCTNER